MEKEEPSWERSEPLCGLIQKTILSCEVELYLSPEVGLLPTCAWRLYPVSFRMLHMMMCTLPAAQPSLPEWQGRDAPMDKLWAPSNACVGKRQREQRSPAPCRHSVRLPLAGPVGQRRGTGTLLQIPYCLTWQLHVGAEDTFKEERGWRKKSKCPGISYISFVCVFPLQHSWQPKRVLWPWKEPSCLSSCNTWERRY